MLSPNSYTQRTKKILWDGSSATVNYLGESLFASSTLEAVWRIKRLTYSGTNNTDITVEYADGNENFDNIWANRTSLTYV
jgi:hypothetical protein